MRSFYTEDTRNMKTACQACNLCVECPRLGASPGEVEVLARMMDRRKELKQC